MTVTKTNTDTQFDDMAHIEAELAALGKPYLQPSWTDEFLLAENLQNYFAEVIAGISFINRKQDFDSNLNDSKLKFIKLRSEYYKFSKSDKQLLLLELIQEREFIKPIFG